MLPEGEEEVREEEKADCDHHHVRCNERHIIDDVTSTLAWIPT